MGVTTQAQQLGITNIVAICALALGLSLVVERVMELLKSLYDLIDCRADFDRFWTRRAVRIRNFAEGRLRALEYVSPASMNDFLKKVNDLTLGPDQGYTGTVPTISGDLVRAGAIRISAKVLGALIGIALAVGLKIDLTALFQEPLAGSVRWFGPIATGVAIGLGAGPLHKVIVSLETRRAKRSAQAGAANA